jgi:hypothetical protein
MLFPAKRRVITEKILFGKLRKKDLFRVTAHFDEFLTETFIVEEVSKPIMNVENALRHMDYVFPARQTWKPVKFKIMECENDGDGKMLSKWVSHHLGCLMFEQRGRTAITFAFKRLFDNMVETGSDSWTLYGCIPCSIEERSGSVIMEVNPNYCGYTPFG